MSKIKEKYQEYLNDLFRNRLIKEDSFSASSFVNWCENTNKKPLIEKGVWVEIAKNNSGLWLSEKFKH